MHRLILGKLRNVMRAKTKQRKHTKKMQAKVCQSQAEITEELCRQIKANKSQKPANAIDKAVSVSGSKLDSNSVKRVISSNKSKSVNKRGVQRDKNGHILPGSGSNGGGRPKGSLSNTRASELRQSVRRVEIEIGKPVKKRKITSWLDYQVYKSYDDTSLAIAILARVYPVLKSIEQVTIDGGSMDEQEAETIQKEMQERCKTVLTNTKSEAT